MIWNVALLVLGGALHLSAAQETVTIPVEIAGTRYDVSFPEGSAANDVAREFCVQNAAAFDITTEEQMPGCVGPVADYLVKAVAPEDGVIRVPIEIAGQQYTIDYRAGAKLEEVAREFCVRNAAAFGITTEEQMPNCVTPVTQFLNSHAEKK
jgi:phage tail sheath gpL-like